MAHIGLVLSSPSIAGVLYGACWFGLELPLKAGCVLRILAWFRAPPKELVCKLHVGLDLGSPPPQDLICIMYVARYLLVRIQPHLREQSSVNCTSKSSPFQSYGKST